MSQIRIYDTKKHSTDDYDFQDLLQLQMLIANLEDQGIDIEMINRNRTPEVFDSFPVIAQLYRENGDHAFPCTVRDDVVLKTGKLPTKQEILDMLNHDGIFCEMESVREDDRWIH